MYCSIFSNTNNVIFLFQILDIFFDVCVSFATQPCLQLENFNDMLKAKLIRQLVKLFFIIILSVLPRIFRIVVGFYIAFSAVYPVYT